MPASERLQAAKAKLAELRATLDETRRILDQTEARHRSLAQAELVDGVPYPRDRRAETIGEIHRLKAAVTDAEGELALTAEALPKLERLVAVEAYQTRIAEARTIAESARPVALAALDAANAFIAAYAELLRLANRRNEAINVAARLRDRNKIDRSEASADAGAFPLNTDRLAQFVENVVTKSQRDRVIAGERIILEITPGHVDATSSILDAAVTPDNAA